MSWVTLSIFAALVYAIGSIVDKFVLSKLVDKPIVPVIVVGITGVIASIIIYFVRGFGALSGMNILWGLLAGAFFILVALFYFKAAKLEEISRVAPLFFVSPIFTAAIAAVFLGEALNPTKYFGVLLLIVGAILISLKKPYSFRLGKAFWLMMLVAFFFSLNWVITKYLLDFTDFWTVFAYTRIGSFLFLIPITILSIPTLKSVYRRSGAKAYALMATKEYVALSGTLAITIAATTGFITLINALVSVQMFFVLIFTTVLSFFFPRIIKEETDKATLSLKTIATISMLGGVYLIS